MTFIFRMALREIRASWRRLLFFFVCIAVGVASIVAIRSLIQSVREGLTQEARAMTGADVVVRSDRPLSDAVRAAVARERASGKVGVVYEAVEMATMVRPSGAASARMVELRAVQDAFPLYGTMTLSEGTYSHSLLRGGGALVRPELLMQLGMRVGDDILIGTERFQIRGVIESEPGRNLGAFSLGSRVFIDLADLASGKHHRRAQLNARSIVEIDAELLLLGKRARRAEVHKHGNQHGQRQRGQDAGSNLVAHYVHDLDSPFANAASASMKPRTRSSG